MAAPETPDLRGAGGQKISRAGYWWWLATALAAGLVLGVGSLALLRMLARPLALVIIAAALATALLPLIRWLSRRMSRTLAVFLVFFALVLLFLLLGWLITPSLIDQGQAFVAAIPRLFDFLQEQLGGFTIPGETSLPSSIFSQLGSLATALVSLPVAIVSSLFDILLILFVALYGLLLLPSMGSFVLSLFPARRRAQAAEVFERIGSAMGGYVRGSAINGVIVGLLTYIGLLLIGVDYALVLGVLAGLLEIIPVVGPIIAGIVIVATALLESLTTALIAGVYVLVMQQLESNILVPNIMRNQTDIPPLLVLLTVYAGATVGGLVGALAAIPLMAALRVLVIMVIAPAIRRASGAESP